MKRNLSWFSSVSCLGLLAILSACIHPYRSHTSVSPAIDTCHYKTYTFLVPDDQTETKWLNNPDHMKALEDILRKELNKRGLHEVSDVKESADLEIRQHLESTTSASIKGHQISATPDPYRLGKWRVELLQTIDDTAVWSFQIDMVIDDTDKNNLKAARAEAHKAFDSDYPRCK